MLASDLPRLADPFTPDAIEWKPGAVTRDKSKGLAMAYISSRAVQDRLDTVCGPADWRNEFREGPGGGVLCGLSVYVERADGTAEWVTKWDGADNTDVEAVKGGLSGSMKRAAVQWGIGRYLYGLPAQWVRLDERGRFAEAPRVPSAAGASAARRSGPSPSGRAGGSGARSESTRPSGERPGTERPGTERSGGERSGGERPRPTSGQRRIVRPAGDGASGEPRLNRPS